MENIFSYKKCAFFVIFQLLTYPTQLTNKLTQTPQSGKQFLIKNAVVWNLNDKNQCYKGQAAWCDQWTFL